MLASFVSRLPCRVVRHQPLLWSAGSFRCAAAAASSLDGQTIGFVGLGKIGSGMVGNLLKASASVVAFDRDSAAVAAIVKAGASAASSAADVADRTSLVFTALPDDRVLNIVAEELLPALAEGAVHVSCSTVGPSTTRALAKAHAERGVGFVAAPVFARPDGMRKGDASIPISGPQWAKARAVAALEATSKEVRDFGEEPGAANVVKLGGNFLIAAAIQSIAEAAALAESHGVDREEFVSWMSSTIFDCLIYRGYGHRVAARDHHPYPDAHFALDLGSKDVSLVYNTAVEGKCPMPIASLLRDRYVAAQNAGRGKLDWSALALRTSEDAGVDISKTLDELLKAKDAK